MGQISTKEIGLNWPVTVACGKRGGVAELEHRCAGFWR